VSTSAPTTCNDAQNVVLRPFNTTDDSRMWLAPYTKGQNHVVVVVLPHDGTRLSLIRVWNYNNGRVHTNRGARLVEITLDDQHVFRGEIAQATGEATPQSAPANAETFILTDDEAVLTAVAATLDADVVGDAATAANARAQDNERSLCESAPSGFLSVTHATVDTPTTAANVPECRSLCIEFLDTWGSGVVVGLSAIRLLDPNGDDIEDVEAALEVPSDVAATFAASADEDAGLRGGSTPLSALFDADATTAWFARLVPGLKLRLDLPEPKRVASLLVANAGIFDRSCGARTVAITRDGSETLTEDLVLRKTPGTLGALLFQTVRLSDLCAGGANATTVAHSVTARAAIGLRRAAMLQQAWPDFYASAAPNVALLPVGYVFELRVSAIEPPSMVDVGMGSDSASVPAAASEDLVVRAVRFEEADDGAKPDRFFAEAPACSTTDAGVRTFAGCGVPGRSASVLCAFDQLRCLIGVFVDVAVPSGRLAEVAVLVDDVPVFEGVLPAAAGRTVVPFTRQLDFLTAHRDALFRADAEV